MSDQQQLNSLNRFRKQSGRLVLEEHSHCEIPAGCGGVVLRWRDSHAILPMSIYLYSSAAAICSLDGNELQISRTDFSVGRHVLTVALEEVDLTAGLILFAASHDPRDYQRGRAAKTIGSPWKVLSAADNSWKYALAPPPPEWTSLNFEEGAWPALVQWPMPALDRDERGYYARLRCADLGAACLGLPPGESPRRGSIWIRKRFEVPAPPEQRS
jgi:hypothetical protein